MKRFFFIGAIWIGLANGVFAQEQKTTTKINWLTWEQAVEANTQIPKKLFVDVYTNWCGWCKRMDATTFSDAIIINYMNKYYYAVKLNAEMIDTIHFNNTIFVNPNPGVNRSTHQLATSLLDNRMSYPSFVVLTNDYKRIQILPGYKTPDAMLPILSYYGEDAYITLTYEEYINSLQTK